MWKEAAEITASCVLFIGMGLEGEIERILSCRFRVLSCPKCLTFWSVLLFGVIAGHGLVETVAVSFLSAYAALWLSLLCDGLTILYNKVYEYYKTTEDASESPSAARHQDAAAQGSEVPEMQLEDNG